MSELLLARAKKGDPKAFEELILPYEKLLINVAFRYMGNIEDAKDAAQESILKIYRSIGTCKTMSSFKAWACRITVNSSIDALRKRKAVFEELSDNLASAIGLPEEEAILADERERIMKALQDLPEDARTLVILRDLQGFSYEEAASIMNIPVGTVSSKLSRARRQLCAKLKDMNGK
jgi:RNA polymerase sigma-70 factor (ECF subfamily)